MSFSNGVDLDRLKGEIVSHVDVDKTKSEILITMQSGKQYMIFHEPDCCETVEIDRSQDGDGDIVSLIGKRIESVSLDEESQKDPPPSEYSESWTRARVTFRTNSETVVSRWIGESNGYYSESITIAEILS